MIDDAARPGIDDEEHHRLFMLLLRAATAPCMRDEDFSREQEIAATLTDDDFGDLALRWREPQHCFAHTRSAVTCHGITRDCPAKILARGGRAATIEPLKAPQTGAR